MKCLPTTCHYLVLCRVSSSSSSSQFTEWCNFFMREGFAKSANCVGRKEECKNVPRSCFEKRSEDDSHSIKLHRGRWERNFPLLRLFRRSVRQSSILWFLFCDSGKQIRDLICAWCLLAYYSKFLRSLWDLFNACCSPKHLLFAY